MCYRYLKHTDVSLVEIECVSHAVNNRVLASAKTHGFVSVENCVLLGANNRVLASAKTHGCTVDRLYKLGVTCPNLTKSCANSAP